MKQHFLFLFFVLSWHIVPAQIKFTSVKTSLGTITDISHAGDGSNRVFITSKGGTVLILGNAFNTLGTFLNLTGTWLQTAKKFHLDLPFTPTGKQWPLLRQL
jgi:hypothetical protein